MTSENSMHEAEHPMLVLWDNPEGCCGDDGGKGVQYGGTHVYLWLIHVDVYHIDNIVKQYCFTSQYCKAIRLQLK